MTNYNQIDWYSDFTYTVAAGDRQPINALGKYITLLESSSDELRISINGQRGGKLPQGLSLELPELENFTKIDLVNDTASAITFTVALSNGKIIDARTVLSGAVEVRNDPLNTPLDVEDNQVYVQVNSLRTEQFNFKNDLLEQLRHQRDLEGCTNFYNAGTTTTITSGTNVNGIYVPILNWSCYATNKGYMTVGGVQVTPHNGNSSGTNSGTITNIFVPSGVQVQFISNNSATVVSGSYQVL